MRCPLHRPPPPHVSVSPCTNSSAAQRTMPIALGSPLSSVSEACIVEMDAQGTQLNRRVQVSPVQHSPVASTCTPTCKVTWRNASSHFSDFPLCFPSVAVRFTTTTTHIVPMPCHRLTVYVPNRLRLEIAPSRQPICISYLLPHDWPQSLCFPQKCQKVSPRWPPTSKNLGESPRFYIWILL